MEAVTHRGPDRWWHTLSRPTTRTNDTGTAAQPVLPLADDPGTSPVLDAEEALSALLDATRALLWIETPAEAATLVRSLVDMLGGEVGTRPDDPAALPFDVSFGDAEPSFVTPGSPDGAERLLLERHLPALVRDTHRALELADRATRLAEEAAVDPLTGLSNRRVLGHTLGQLRADDTVIVIDLDHFKRVNDSWGHEEGDRVLRAFGRALTDAVRASDRVGRYGGEEFVVVLAGGEADPFLRRFQREWGVRRPHPVTFSAGVAPAGPHPHRAVRAADRAMYRAKGQGRDQWLWATEDEYR